jgi:hypothetical protein
MGHPKKGWDRMNFYFLIAGILCSAFGGLFITIGFNWDKIIKTDTKKINWKSVLIGLSIGIIGAFLVVLGSNWDRIIKKNGLIQMQGTDDVEVVYNKIFDSQKGYMRVKVKKEYLNTNFEIPTTLKYTSGKYQPMLLTFTNDSKWGAGIIFNSPEHSNRASIFLNQQIRFEGFGKMIYIKDLILDLYFNDYCIYLIPKDGMITFDKIPQKIVLNGPTCLGYFDEDSPKNKNATKDLTDIITYFQKYR